MSTVRYVKLVPRVTQTPRMLALTFTQQGKRDAVVRHLALPGNMDISSGDISENRYH